MFSLTVWLELFEHLSSGLINMHQSAIPLKPLKGITLIILLKWGLSSVRQQVNSHFFKLICWKQNISARVLYWPVMGRSLKEVWIRASLDQQVLWLLPTKTSELMAGTWASKSHGKIWEAKSSLSGTIPQKIYCSTIGWKSYSRVQASHIVSLAWCVWGGVQ